MGRVFRQGELWAIRYDKPDSCRKDRKQKQIGGFTTEAKASRALKMIEAKITTGVYIDENQLTVDEGVDLWLKDHVIVNLSPKTYEYYVNKVDRYIKPYLGPKKIAKLKTKDILDFYKTIKAELGATTDILSKVHETLRAAFNKLQEWELISNAENVMLRVKHPGTDRQPFDFWDYDAIQAGLAYFVGKSVEYHVTAAVNLGLREGEACGLRECDLDFNAKTIHIDQAVQRIVAKGLDLSKMAHVKEVHGNVIVKDTKNTSSNRYLPMTPEMEAYFKYRILEQMKYRIFFGDRYNKEWLGYFSVDPTGNLIDDQDVCSRYRGYMARSGLKKVTFHDLRHSCASWLYAKGVPMKTISEILGHANLATTSDLYTHVVQDVKRDALERLYK